MSYPSTRTPVRSRPGAARAGLWCCALALALALVGCVGMPVGPGGSDSMTPYGDIDGSVMPGSDSGLGVPGFDSGTPPWGTDASMLPGSYPVDDIDQLSLVILLGDSLAAGYNAQGNNGPSGRGYGRMVVNNHPDYPAYIGHDLTSMYGPIDFRDLSDSGATSGEVLSTLQSALSGGLPASVPGDVLVMINVGGNDFNDDILTMISTPVTMAAAANLRSNVGQMFTLLRNRYEDLAAGKHVAFLVDNIHDTTDGLGTVPPQFDNGFCGTIQSPLFTPALRAAALSNLDLMNTELESEVLAQGGNLVDIHAGFIGHGMNSGADRWIDGDCAHPTNDGHDLVRRLNWEMFTGETYP